MARSRSKLDGDAADKVSGQRVRVRLSRVGWLRPSLGALLAPALMLAAELAGDC